MGFYLNSAAPGALYKSETENPYFVDKSQLLEALIPFVQQGNKHICITRPRRFGKTVMANMIGAFFGKGEGALSAEEPVVLYGIYPGTGPSEGQPGQVRLYGPDAVHD